MFGLGWQELTIILVIILVVYGPKRLPQIGKSVGKSIRNMKNALNGIDVDIEDEVVVAAEDDPVKDTTDIEKLDLRNKN
ncbi:twin-arginine translocase TatA/TatE family subunit [bacterium]|nr:twin-arginine translocase TatA/TatE family subunit [bacterium]